MGLSKLNYLYRTLVLAHASHPHHQGKLPDATAQTTLSESMTTRSATLSLPAAGVRFRKPQPV